MADAEWPVNVPEERMEECLCFLDDLRESGVTNMFGAREYIQEWYEEVYEEKIGKHTAGAVLSYWMKTFGDREDARQKGKNEDADMVGQT